ncbi:MAG: helix-turn-helix transcriptional regulator [Methylorubrum populi]
MSEDTAHPPVAVASAEFIAGTIARRMKELRVARGLSLQALADNANLTKSHVWELENGRARNPTIGTAVSIATALGVSLDYLAGLTTARPSLHPEALRIACEVDALLRGPRVGDARQGEPTARPEERLQGTACGGSKVPAGVIGLHRRRLAAIEATWEARGHLDEGQIAFLIRMAGADLAERPGAHPEADRPHV